MLLFQKKKFLRLLSIPTTLKHFLQKKSTDSDPTKPDEPVIKTTDIKNILLSCACYYEANHKCL